MVRQTAEWLQDHESAAAMSGMVQDLTRDQDAFSGIEGVVDDRIALLYEFRKPDSRFSVKRMVFRDFVCRVVGEIEEHVCHPVPELFLERLI